MGRSNYGSLLYPGQIKPMVDVKPAKAYKHLSTSESQALGALLSSARDR